MYTLSHVLDEELTLYINPSKQKKAYSTMAGEPF